MLTRQTYLVAILFFCVRYACAQATPPAWIRINQLGYAPNSHKVAVFASKVPLNVASFDVVDVATMKVAAKFTVSKDFGAYGPFTHTWRLDFTTLTKEGKYFLQVGNVRSPEFRVGADVYKGTADFALRYMRQQRSGYNPFLKDSCHTHDGYTVYGPMPDGTYVDVSGGWHDATDYLQYVATSANATYHLLAAYRDFAPAFEDRHLDNGLPGSNGKADVLDEAEWGLRWLLKMHPREDWMFNQLADDRDHSGFRLPNHDSVDYGYGPGKGRPVYFLTGDVQGLGKHKNRATGTSSTGGKMASAFALGAMVIGGGDPARGEMLRAKSRSAYAFAERKPGVSQTAPNKAPYFYEEDNWVDDVELAAASLYALTGEKNFRNEAMRFAEREHVTPWMGSDTARHYQWYPFHNFGHYELSKAGSAHRKKMIAFYREGIERVWKKAQHNAFLRGVPFIWCSNNLTVSFTIHCYLYRTMSGDNTYIALEQAGFDWIFGVNPWGTSMVCGLPAHGDTPEDPHSSLTHLHGYTLDGGMVDGPVYGSIYNGLLGIRLAEADEYAEFQSSLAVYHDDFGDYSTNEPTMDGTASLVYLLAAKEWEQLRKK